ncbi:trehalose-phosphatase [Candidatus Bathyarchaeota archaeon]|nr:trehalose-phosphatase [Candidatus Bathyarchaeota archaeon]
MEVTNLFDHLQEIQKEIDKADLLALLLDYDGTLVPFKDRPEEAVATPNLQKVLRTLARSPKCWIAVVSGRRLESLKQVLGVDGLCLAGLHGLQIEFPDGRNFVWKPARKVTPTLRDIRQRAIHELGGEDGLYIEDKGFTLALHYRLLPREKVQDITQRFIDIVESRGGGREPLEIIRGSEVIEIRPKGWDKGKAVSKILKRLDGKVLPMYFGDDLTDEDAFRRLKNGVTVFVSEDADKSTAAAYSLRDHREVYRFLCWLLEECVGTNEFGSSRLGSGKKEG